MILVPYNQSYTLPLYLPARADATPTATVYTPAGGSLQTPTVTRDSVATTLSGSASAGASSVTVTSATGITVGRRYLLAGGEDAGGEEVTVKSISGTTITLVRPLRLAAASGASFECARITLALSAITPVGRAYRVEIAWAVSTVSQPAFVADFDVVRYFPRSGLTAEQIRDFDPLFNKRLPAGTWIPGLLDKAWDMVLARVAQKVPPGGLAGSNDLTIPHAYLTRALLLETAGPEQSAEYERLMTRYTSELDVMLAASAVDNNQDGAIESNEGWYRSIDVARG